MQSPCSPLDTMLTLDAAAAYLDMSRSSFERHVQPFISTVRLTPRLVRVKIDELDRWKQAPEILPTVAEITVEEGVYFLQHGEAGLIKIGSSDRVRTRVLAIRSMSPVPLRFLGSTQRGNHPRASYWYKNLEHDLHLRLESHRDHGEWFRSSPPVRFAIAEALR